MSIFFQAIDSRLAQVWMGVTSLMVCMVIAFVSCWQVALAGATLDILLGSLSIYLAFAIKQTNQRLAKIDDSGQVREQIES
jgi:hypothetical protein